MLALVYACFGVLPPRLVHSVRIRPTVTDDGVEGTGDGGTVDSSSSSPLVDDGEGLALISLSCWAGVTCVASISMSFPEDSA
eukprot:SAG31_NODE_4224_length_3447_cov_2.493130_1_plen_81_part_10